MSRLHREGQVHKEPGSTGICAVGNIKKLCHKSLKVTECPATESRLLGCNLLVKNRKGIFSCGEATTLMEMNFLSFFFLIICPKEGQTVQTNMVAYKVWVTDFKSEVRSDLRGCLEAKMASKPHFLCWSPIDGSS